MGEESCFRAEIISALRLHFGRSKRNSQVQELPFGFRSKEQERGRQWLIVLLSGSRF